MYTQRIEKGFNKHMHIYIHSNTTHSSQKVGAAHMSINRWMDKQIGVCVCVYTYIMEYYSAIKRNETFHICYDMGEPLKHYAKWKKPNKKGDILYHYINMKYPE